MPNPCYFCGNKITDTRTQIDGSLYVECAKCFMKYSIYVHDDKEEVIYHGEKHCPKCGSTELSDADGHCFECEGDIQALEEAHHRRNGNI